MAKKNYASTNGRIAIFLKRKRVSAFVNRKLSIDFHLRYTQLFANAFHCHFLYVWMTWNRSEISI